MALGSLIQDQRATNSAPPWGTGGQHSTSMAQEECKTDARRPPPQVSQPVVGRHPRAAVGHFGRVSAPKNDTGLSSGCRSSTMVPPSWWRFGDRVCAPGGGNADLAVAGSSEHAIRGSRGLQRTPRVEGSGMS